MHIGIDLGSRFIKIAVKKGENIEFFGENTIDFYKKWIGSANDKVTINMAFLGEGIEGAEILGTGYGRNLIQFDNIRIISEIKAHFHGAKSQCEADNFVLVDIGGQDCKVIHVTDGYIDDFTMNDKCAASTGRFVEQAAGILDIPVEDFGRMVDNPARLSDTCAVFCESELIGQLARGVSAESLAAGVNLSVARRLAPAVKKYKPSMVFTSGGAATYGINKFIAELAGADVRPLPEQQYNGALGCLEFLRRNLFG